MAEGRSAKATMRQLWISRIAAEDRVFRDASRPLYLTLCGPAGTEIDLLVQGGVLRRTEVGSVSPEDLRKIVAVEASPGAEVALRQRFPGLTVCRGSVESLVRGGHERAWPNGVHETYCRARLINLDLNQPLEACFEAGQIQFPVVDWIVKLADVHAVDVPGDWVLFLTLHGQVTWDAELTHGIEEVLSENFRREPNFAEGAKDVLGGRLYGAIQGGDALNWSEVPWEEHQRLLMVLVPKALAQRVHNRGWRVATVHNYRYGGTGGHAPMVAWTLELHWDARATRTPEALYRESLQQIFIDRKSTRLNSSHLGISYAVFC